MDVALITLIAKAMERDGNNVFPIGGRKEFKECITNYNGKTLLWYDHLLSDGNFTSRIVVLE